MFKELKIDAELRDFLPSLSQKSYDTLEKKLVAEGYKGQPIYTWNGYIVDGHNRYEICKKHNIEFISEELILCNNATKVDYMEWMLNNQDARRNLSPAERLVAAEKLREKIAEEAKEKQKEAGKEYGNGINSFTPNGENLKSEKVHTDKEIAKIARVGTGTVARFNKVMQSDDEDTKQKVRTGQMTINAGYEKVKSPKVEKEVDAHAIEQIDELSEIEKEIKDEIPESIKEICKDLKTEKTKEYFDSIWDLHENVLDCVESMFEDFINPLKSSIDEIDGRINEQERQECIECIELMSDRILKITDKISEMRLKEC